MGRVCASGSGEGGGAAAPAAAAPSRSKPLVKEAQNAVGARGANNKVVDIYLLYIYTVSRRGFKLENKVVSGGLNIFGAV